MSCSKLRVFQEPQWFIKFDGRKLETNEDVVSDLKTLNKQLVVVTAIGSYRTGKSWILNRLTGCKHENGFKVADGQSSVTHGLWIYCQEHPHKDNCIMVFLDTEGLHDPFKDDSTNEDNRLFIVAFLLCNVLIYNVSKKFDNNDLQKVGFITHISERLQKSEAMKIYPEFILLVRDVSKLKLYGDVVEPNEYLHKVLTSGDQSSTLTPKTCILQNCKNRHCFTMSFPSDDYDDADTLHLGNVLLKQKYLEDERVLKTHLFQEADVKRVSSGSPCTVKVFCGIIPDIVKIVEDGGIPTVTSIQHRVAQEENERLRIDVRKRFEAFLCDESENDLYDSFEEKSSEFEKRCTKELENNLVPISEEEMKQCLQDFKDFAKSRVEATIEKNCQAARDACLEQILKNVHENKYQPPGCKDEFQNDVDQAYRQYKEMASYFGHEKLEIWEQKQVEILRCRELLKLRDSDWDTKRREQELREQQREELDRMRRERAEREQELKEQQREELDRMRRENERQLALRAEQEARRANQEFFGQMLAGALNIGAALINAAANLDLDDSD